jgi:hypothetical protein
MMDETVTVPGAGVFRWCTPCCCARMELFDRGEDTRDSGSTWRRDVDLAALEREVGTYADDARERASQLRAPRRATWPDNSLSELETMLCSLTYGEMMEFAEGIMQQAAEKPTDANSLAAVIHRWAVRNRQQLVATGTTVAMGGLVPPVLVSRVVHSGTPECTTFCPPYRGEEARHGEAQGGSCCGLNVPYFPFRESCEPDVRWGSNGQPSTDRPGWRPGFAYGNFSESGTYAKGGPAGLSFAFAIGAATFICTTSFGISTRPARNAFPVKSSLPASTAIIGSWRSSSWSFRSS